MAGTGPPRHLPLYNLYQRVPFAWYEVYWNVTVPLSSIIMGHQIVLSRYSGPFAENPGPAESEILPADQSRKLRFMLSYALRLFNLRVVTPTQWVWRNYALAKQYVITHVTDAYLRLCHFRGSRINASITRVSFHVT